MSYYFKNKRNQWMGWLATTTWLITQAFALDVKYCLRSLDSSTEIGAIYSSQVSSVSDFWLK